MGQKHMEYLVDSFLHVFVEKYRLYFNVILSFKGFMDGGKFARNRCESIQSYLNVYLLIYLHAI